MSFPKIHMQMIASSEALTNELSSQVFLQLWMRSRSQPKSLRFKPRLHIHVVIQLLHKPRITNNWSDHNLPVQGSDLIISNSSRSSCNNWVVAKIIISASMNKRYLVWETLGVCLHKLSSKSIWNKPSDWQENQLWCHCNIPNGKFWQFTEFQLTNDSEKVSFN